MAKARAIPGLSAQEPYASAAASIVEVRARELIDHAHGVLDTGSIERVHDMRVATRRLRAALEIFNPCFSRREHKSALREVKALADALGERRDRDVAIDSLGAIGAAMSATDRLGIETLVARMREEQSEANDALGRFVTEDKLAALGEQLAELAASAHEPEHEPEPEPEHREPVPPLAPAAVWLPRREDAAA